MEKITHTTRMKLISLLFFSNVVVYLISSEPVEIPITVEEVTQTRKGYIDISIQANLLTSFARNKPVSLISSDKSIYIPYALLTNEYAIPQDQTLMGESSKKKYGLYLPKKHLPTLLKGHILNIVPFENYNLTKVGRPSYEISI